MTGEGIERLLGYQRSYFGKDWRHNMTAGDIAEVKMAYRDAFKDYDDDAVLAGYMKHVKEWDRLPSIAQVMAAADSIASARSAGGDGYKCRVCGLPWRGGEGFGRDEGRVPGEAQKVVRADKRGEMIGRCPACNARLSKAVPAWVFLDGITLANDVSF